MPHWVCSIKTWPSMLLFPHTLSPPRMYGFQPRHPEHWHLLECRSSQTGGAAPVPTLTEPSASNTGVSGKC